MLNGHRIGGLIDWLSKV